MNYNVAPSFVNYEPVSEPFTKNGKQYITARNLNTGKERDIRIYTDSEFRKQYPNTESKDTGFAMLKHARGFDYGPILVIRNDKPEDESWLRASVARYAVGVGWYIASEDTFPNNAPAHFKYLLLGWSEVRHNDDNHIKKPEEISAIINKKIQKGEWVNFNG